MENEEVLSNNQKEGNDEYKVKIFNEAQTAGIVIIVVISVFFLIANAAVTSLRGLERDIISFDYAAILFAYLSGVCFFSYTKSKILYHLIIGFGFALTFLCLLFLFFIHL
jgi:hypothetical protein